MRASSGATGTPVRREELKALKTSTLKQKEDVTVRFGLDSIPEEVYKTTLRHLTDRLDKIEAELHSIENQNSNRESLVDDILATACHLDTLWLNGDLKTKLLLQKLVFPDGLIFDRASASPRTSRENPAFAAFRRISEAYSNEYKTKSEKSCDFSDFVAGEGLEPPASGL